MTSSSPIHHSRFPAQQGQAALLAATTVSSPASFTQAAWDRQGQLGKSPSWEEGNGLLTPLNTSILLKTRCKY